MVWFLCIATTHQGHLRLSGPPSGQGTGGGARTPIQRYRKSNYNHLLQSFQVSSCTFVCARESEPFHCCGAVVISGLVVHTRAER
ncbi:hypothetical protein PoB_007587600 [Plakobranchus ocellatus]|uniref:Secreted protein n=1 Tax=Plakobranchus ocellatus TaxID=259542 RepID=A0AAV4DZ64_9GAST|nr:hypothetical protein PoB_007587600 [Plakobranchus ocellatus]